MPLILSALAATYQAYPVSHPEEGKATSVSLEVEYRLTGRGRVNWLSVYRRSIRFPYGEKQEFLHKLQTLVPREGERPASMLRITI